MLQDMIAMGPFGYAVLAFMAGVCVMFLAGTVAVIMMPQPPNLYRAPPPPPWSEHWTKDANPPVQTGDIPPRF